MKNKVFLGIDTSNYTTSCAVCDTNGNIIDNYKVLLPVKDGENGLRQSEAVFAHIKNFQIIAEKIREKYQGFTQENVMDILQKEIGIVFTAVLEDAGVFKCTEEGRSAFRRFISAL